MRDDPSRLGNPQLLVGQPRAEVERQVVAHVLHARHLPQERCRRAPREAHVGQPLEGAFWTAIQVYAQRQPFGFQSDEVGFEVGLNLIKEVGRSDAQVGRLESSLESWPVGRGEGHLGGVQWVRLGRRSIPDHCGCQLATGLRGQPASQGDDLHCAHARAPYEEDGHGGDRAWAGLGEHRRQEKTRRAVRRRRRRDSAPPAQPPGHRARTSARADLPAVLHAGDAGHHARQGVAGDDRAVGQRVEGADQDAHGLFGIAALRECLSKGNGKEKNQQPTAHEPTFPPSGGSPPAG